MADVIGGPLSPPKPAQVSEEDAAAYARQQQIKAGAMDLVNPMGLVGVGVTTGKKFVQSLVGKEVRGQMAALTERLQALNATLERISMFAGPDLVVRPGISEATLKVVLDEHRVVLSALRKLQRSGQ